MAQPVAERAVQVRPVVERVHLVHADAGPVASAWASMASSRRHGLAVGQRDDEVGARPDVLKDVGGIGRDRDVRHSGQLGLVGGDCRRQVLNHAFVIEIHGSSSFR